VPMRNAVCKWL